MRFSRRVCKHAVMLVLTTVVVGYLVLGMQHPARAQETRDPLLWPFAATSIWNMPIGSNAAYTPARIPASAGIGMDENYLVTTSTSDPQRPFFAPGAWGQGRCTGTQQLGTNTYSVPNSLVVPDATQVPYSTPNNAAAILQPDMRSMVQVEPLARCTAGGNVYGWVDCGWGHTEDIEGAGICGGHSGSGLSSIGGEIHTFELQMAGAQTIPHALQLELDGSLLYHCTSTVKGFRWPAGNADSAACNASGGYSGNNSSVMQGSLLAMPPSVTPTSLGLTSDVGRKLFYALQNYGGYVVDDSGGWNQIGVEHGLPQHFDFSAGAMLSDINKLFTALAVVDNNAPDAIGGGGTPRAALAPPFGAPGSGNSIPPTATALATLTRVTTPTATVSVLATANTTASAGDAATGANTTSGSTITTKPAANGSLLPLILSFLALVMLGGGGLAWWRMRRRRVTTDAQHDEGGWQDDEWEHPNHAYDTSHAANAAPSRQQHASGWDDSGWDDQRDNWNTPQPDETLRGW